MRLGEGRIFYLTNVFDAPLGSVSEVSMDKRVAIIGIIVEEGAEVDRLNELLHEYASYIIGRMGIPYRERGVNIISVAVDAPSDVISALGGKLGRLRGVTSKAVYSPV